MSHGMCLLRDNALPHSAHVTTALLEKFKCDILDHLPYSPDLAPSDFHLFLRLKKHLTGKNFKTVVRCKKSPDMVQRAGGTLL
jgi:hypothetical protein